MTARNITSRDGARDAAKPLTDAESIAMLLVGNVHTESGRCYAAGRNTETMNDTIYLAIHKDADKTVVIEYTPLADGAIEIVSVSISPRPRSLFEARRPKPRRGLTLNNQDEAVEATAPYLRAEIFKVSGG